MAFSDLHTLNLDWVIKQIKQLLQTNLTKDSIVQELLPGQGADLIPSAPAVMRYVDEHGGGSAIVYPVTDYGVLTTNSPTENSAALQMLIDTISSRGGGVIYFPSGVYRFGATGKGAAGQYCVKLRSNITICGEGLTSVLKIAGHSTDGLDMFHFNELADSNVAAYLDNCVFSDFVVDGAEQSLSNYISAGKAFMINLMRSCHWYNVHVRNIDATGFGMDCPIDCSMSNCTATNCGKATSDVNAFGASGIGIGFGYSESECMTISDCICNNNRHFGVFFEHQGRFSSGKYRATINRGFTVSNSVSVGNGYNFGAILGVYVHYTGCQSVAPVRHGFFMDTCNNSDIKACHHVGQGDSGSAAYAIYATNTYGAWRTTDVVMQGNSCKYARKGFLVNSSANIATDNTRIVVADNVALACTESDIDIRGKWGNVEITGNVSTTNSPFFDTSGITTLVNMYNTWNTQSGGMTKFLLTFDGTQILSGSEIVTFTHLRSLLLQEPAFVVLIYNEYAYHPNAVTDSQIVFTSAHPVNGYDKSRRITMLSNGTVTVSETEAEKTSSRVAAIGAGDVGSTTKYPSIKAVVDYVGTRIGVIESNLSTLADYAEEVSA